MSKDYKPQSAAGMEASLYYRTLGLIRDYPRLKEQAEELLHPGATSTDGQPHGTGTTDQVADIAARRESVLADIAAIEQGLALIPEECRDVVFENIVDRRPYKDIPSAEYAHRNTWSKYRGLFVLYVAQNKGWI